MFRRGAKISKFFIVLLLLTGWIFSGWPQILNFPSEIKEAKAAENTIDATVTITSASHNGSSPTTVFTSASVGYAFYVDSTNYCAYSKTTDGGVTWGAAVNVYTTTANCVGVAVWYDQWTPGDTTGTLIHIAVIDITNDDIFYRNLNTSTDTLSAGPVNITSGLSYAGALTAALSKPAITKGTDGVLYASVAAALDNMMVRCTTTCTTATNWAVSEPASWTIGDDWTILVPMLSGKIMFIWWDISATTNDLKYSVWSGSSWSAFANIATALDNTTYDASFGATVDRSTGNIYLAYAQNAATLGTDDNIKTAVYSSGAWTTKTNVVTTSACAGGTTCGVTGAKIYRDETSGTIYAVYTARSTAGTAATGNVYFKYSNDGMTSWSSEAGPVNTAADDIYGARVPIMGPRGYVTHYRATPDDLFGRSIAPLVLTQSAYRFDANYNSTYIWYPFATNQDIPTTIHSTWPTFRLRMLLHVGSSDLVLNGEQFKLQFVGKGTGTCASPSGGTPATYTDVTAATAIAFRDNPAPANNAAMGPVTSDPLHGGDTIVNQTYEELNNFTNSVSAVPIGQDGKWDFSLYDNGAPAGTTYCFRAVKSDNSVIIYDKYPEITTSQSTFDQTSYRWFSNNNSLSVGDPLAGENATSTAPSQGTPFRLRTLLYLNGKSVSVGNGNFKLQVAQRGTDNLCDAQFSGESYSDVATSSGAIRFYDNSGATDGANLTATSSDPANFYDDFSSHPTEVTHPEGDIYKLWQDIWDSQGYQKVTTATSNNVLEQKPRVVTTPGDTASNFTFGPYSSSTNLTFESKSYTVAQTRTGSAPNAWEVPWVWWNRSNDTTEGYYFYAGLTGWELGYHNSADAQGFLQTGVTPTFPIHNWYTIRVEQTTGNIKVYVNNTLTANYSNASLYTSGRIALYDEDAQVHFDNIKSSLDVVNQTYEEANNFSNASVWLAYQAAKWDFSLVDDSAPGSTTYCFRVVKSDDSLLDSYTNIPEITTAVAATVSVSISDGIVTYGTMAAGTSKTTVSLTDTQILTNDGGTLETFNIKGQNTACPWTLAAAVGTDQYVHQFCKATDVSCAAPPTNYTALTTNYQPLYTGVAAAGTRQLDLRLIVPSLSSCFTSQSADVTIQAVAQ